MVFGIGLLKRFWVYLGNNSQRYGFRAIGFRSIVSRALVGRLTLGGFIGFRVGVRLGGREDLIAADIT